MTHGWIVFLWIVVMVFCGIGWAVSSEDGWWETESWRYNDPAANQPSDTAFELSRIKVVAVAVVATLAAIGLW
ncbi:hypothetical protein [Yinghuangia seranimata]|uniref:hypothetical protein n=1 Tax=Yinghuangia seranimata TaxID=408067 RepID=UPI00248BF905|nr:hypothetical protein [Yinghuangia seranimata]MDI2131593.1 hypothetical protein [Yinghuangia seranimata]